MITKTVRLVDQRKKTCTQAVKQRDSRKDMYADRSGHIDRTTDTRANRQTGNHNYFGRLLVFIPLKYINLCFLDRLRSSMFFLLGGS